MFHSLKTVFRFAILPLALLLALSCASHAGQPRTGILLVAFGTSVPEAKPAFASIEAAYKKAFPDCPIEWAFTSQIIRKKLASRGEPVASIGEGLTSLARDGVEVVRVQSLHIMAGEEFAELARALLLNIKQHPDRFRAVYLVRPLLESRADARDVAQAILIGQRNHRSEKEALILMGHGQEHGRADLVFEGARATFREFDPLVFMATVEGARTFEDLLKDLKAAHVKNVVLAPLMLVAGDHARNDLAGEEEDSWASRLKAAGYQVRTNLSGLGQIPGIADIFIRHTKDSKDDLVSEPKKP